MQIFGLCVSENLPCCFSLGFLSPLMASDLERIAALRAEIRSRCPQFNELLFLTSLILILHGSCNFGQDDEKGLRRERRTTISVFFVSWSCWIIKLHLSCETILAHLKLLEADLKGQSTSILIYWSRLHCLTQANLQHDSEMYA
ncbi:hypothetical protein K7X08_028939 [Anisodus acutangulus]|uniref:Uncharacterized protein n=1 Tax=Anisodus acutangulus TaxID=402998 RepID=A0A9Q1L469_9SOLA|nr:hypothetical protein K7X08_028939 [Anisodus acutangulus]